MSYAPHLIPDEPAGSRRWMPTALAVLLPITAAVAFAWPTLDAGFQMGDDQRFVTENVLVQYPSWAHAGEILTTPHGDLYQPVPLLSFQATHAATGPKIGSAPSAFAHHLVNLLLHALNAALAALVTLRLTRRAFIGALVGIMFATHPLALETVAWVSGRMMLLATVFSLGLLVLATQRHDQPGAGWRASAIVVWLLACASKVIPTVPIVAALFERTAQTTPRRRNWALYAILFLIGVAATVLMALLTSTAAFSFSEGKSIGQLAGTMLLAFGRYVENYVWPVNLSPWTPPLTSIDWLTVRTLLAATGLVGLLVLAWTLRRRMPIATAGLWMFLLILAPFLAAGLTRRLFVADRYMYLPILGLHIFVVVMLGKLATICTGRDGVTTRRILTAVPILLLCGFWLKTAYALAPTWQSPVQFARRIVETHPNSVMAANELARAYLHEKRPKDALAVIENARERWPDEPRLSAQAGRANAQVGELNEAEAELARAVEAMPQQAAVRYEYALVLDRLGQSAAAIEQLQTILDAHPSFLPAYRASALIHRAQGNRAAEAEMLQQALKQNRFHRNNLFDLATIYLTYGDLNAAEPLLRRILKLHPHDEPALLNLGVVLSRTDRIVDAIKCYDSILARSPHTVSALLNRAALLRQINQSSSAESDLRTARQVEPDNVDVLLALHQALFDQRDWRALIELWEAPTSGEILPGDCIAGWMRTLEAISQQAPVTTPTSKNNGICELLLRMHRALHQNDSAAIRDLIKRYIESSSANDMILSGPLRDIIGRSLNTLPNEIRNGVPGLLTLAVVLDASGSTEQAVAILASLRTMPEATEWQPLIERLDAHIRERRPSRGNAQAPTE